MGLAVGKEDKDDPDDRAADEAPRGSIPAASTMPTAMAQKRKAMSRGSLMAVRKRTMDKAPTMPRERTTLEVTASMTTVVIMVRASRVTPKPEEYITPA